MVEGWFICVSVCQSVCLSVCLCFWKIMNNCRRDGPIWTEFSGVVWLVPSSFLVGSIHAQSPPCRTGPASSPFTCSISPPWPLVIPDHDIQFWKVFDKANKQVWVVFLILALDPQFCVRQAQTMKGVVIFVRIGQFFIKKTPWNQILRIFYDLQLFIRPQPEVVWPWSGLQLGPVLEIYLLRNHWCYWNVTYHFRKHFVCWTNVWERIFDFGPWLVFVG